MGEVIFKVDEVSKSFGDHKVLEQINLDIFSGEIIGLIGESGAGKTTFLHTLIVFLQPEKGGVFFRDHEQCDIQGSAKYLDVAKNQNRLKQLYGFAAQSPSFYEELSVLENLEYFGALHHLHKNIIKSNSSSLLSLVSLDQFKNRPAKQLSGGMARRLDIACALIHNPSILILDEPTADLDPLLRNQMWDLVKKINKKQTTIILSSHHLAELEHICDRIIVLKDNKILAIDKPDVFKKKYLLEKKVIVQTTPGNYSLVLAELKKKNINVVQKDGFLELPTNHPEKLLKEFMSITKLLNEELSYIEMQTGSLDDVFVKLWDKQKDKKKVF
jgi:ABC-2 type transport system ATP-binding protein